MQREQVVFHQENAARSGSSAPMWPENTARPTTWGIGREYHANEY